MNYSLYSKGTEEREDGHKPQLTQKSLQEPSLVLKMGKEPPLRLLFLQGSLSGRFHLPLCLQGEMSRDSNSQSEALLDNMATIFH